MRRERDEEFRRYVVSRSAALLEALSASQDDSLPVEPRLLDVLARTYLTWDGPIDHALLDDHVLAALPPEPVPDEGADDGPDDGPDEVQVGDGPDGVPVGDVVDNQDPLGRPDARVVEDRPRHDPRRFADRVLAEAQQRRRRRSQRVGGAIVAVVLLLAVVPLGQSLHAALVGGQPQPGRTTPRAAQTGGAADTLASAAHHSGVDDAQRRAADTRVRAWVASLRLQSPTPRRPGADQVLRVTHSSRFSGAADFASVAQVRTGAGRWVDVARGDVAWPGRLDSSGHWLSFTVRQTDATHQQARTWVYVVQTDRGQVLVRHPVEFGAALIGWFGDRLVVQRGDDAGSLVFFERHGTGVEQPLAVVVIPKEGTRAGDTAFDERSGTSGCITAGRLGLGPPAGDAAERGTCPGAEVVALSADGRLGVTRDLRWLDVRGGGYQTIGDRPDGVLAEDVQFIGLDRILVTLRAGAGRQVVSCGLHGACTRVPAR
ncbi:MAG: hypothetical protein ACXV2I_04145 [Actinomycetes bacterium]